MSRSLTVADYEIRSYRDEDEARVVELLRTTMGDGPAGPRTAEFFRWKHLENPFGRSLMLVAEAEDVIIGLRAFMRWRFRVGDRRVSAVQAVDTATHPDYQGMGIFSQLTLRALEQLRQDTDLIYNTPNEKSLPGYLKMGWRIIGRFPVSVRVRRPLRFIRNFRDVKHGVVMAEGAPAVRAEPAADVLGVADVEPFVSASGPSAEMLSTDRTIEFLRWRYGAPPGLDYRAVRSDRGGMLAGLAFFRARPRGRLWEVAVTDIVAPPDDGRTVRSLLGSVIRASEVDHLTCHFPSGSTFVRAATRVGFLRSSAGITVVTNALQPAMRPDPRAMRSWAFCLGDLEVF